MDHKTSIVEDLFCAAMEQPGPGERRAFLDQACAGNAALRADVEEMLRLNDRAGRFFDANDPGRLVGGKAPDGESDQSASDEEYAGSRVGIYKLVQKLGEGGCGSVFLAEQEAPMRRHVALKIIKLGMDTRRVIARFEAERQALAMMDHPNIARVLDAGTTAAGRPFFVMELVRGTRITTYCDEQRLDMAGRLALFIQVCHAIQHAHQKGIIHRDIKPSNVLVSLHDGVPVPKVIDFGIAKAVDGGLVSDATPLTMNGQIVGTPTYMSPEQAQMSGLDVDTRSDIYSLGVLLYELLTGMTPFSQQELVSKGVDSMRRTLLEQEPQRPSARLETLQTDQLTQTAFQHHEETSRFTSLLKGDLDWIVMKALDKDRNRRYQTANGLAADVRRHLNNEVVIARPPSRLYQFQKLVRRNKTIFTAGAAIAITLLAALGASMHLYLKERLALREQLRLRMLAEQLQSEAEVRAKIARAVLEIERTNYDAAACLVAGIQVPVKVPSLEAARLFRRLGDWHAQNGRWRDVADCSLKLAMANQVDEADMSDEVTRDFLRVSPSLLIIGDIDTCRRFSSEILHRFGDTRNPIAAEQLIKSTVLIPLDPATLALLEPLARVVGHSIENGGSQDAYMVAWRMFALCLYEYRRGNFEESVRLGDQCLKSRDKTTTRLAMTHAVLCMAHWRMNQREQAALECQVTRDLVDPQFPDGASTRLVSGAQNLFWHDWLIARVLEREAGEMMSAPGQAQVIGK